MTASASPDVPWPIASALVTAGPLAAAWAMVLHTYSHVSNPVFVLVVPSGSGPARLASIRVEVGFEGTTAELVARVQHGIELALAQPELEDARLRLAQGLERTAALSESIVVARVDQLEAEMARVRARVGVALEGTQLTVRAAPGSFDPASLERLVGHVGRALAALAGPQLALAEVDLLGSEERTLLLETWNARHHHDDGRRGETVPALFAEVVAQNPHARAVSARDGELTYAELDRRSNRLARRLQALGVRPEVCVGVCLEHSAELLVTLLAILKAGGAYVPLEPGHPLPRLAGMLDDVDAPIIVTRRELLGSLPEIGTRALLLDEEAATIAALDASPVSSGANAETLAYVLFTSGSTGKPKGVEVPNRAIRRLVCSGGYARLDPTTVVLQTAPVSFDASTFEIWGPLLNGGRIAVYSETMPTAHGLRESIRAQSVTTLWLTSALFNAVIDDDPQVFAPVRELLTGGEALSVTHVRRALAALPKLRLINGYGPTETTTFAACHPIAPSDADGHSIPIGHGIRDTDLYVLDARRRPVPLGAEGELYIGGAGVARGYRNRPELTAERFVANPFGSGLLYRTGDQVRFRPDGALEFLSRNDSQVKIRGFRIELGEIELALARHEAVQSVRVVARAGGVAKRLVAYLVVRPGSVRPDARALGAFLRSGLPDYMVPAAFVWLDQLPVTSNGKLDIGALPEPTSMRPELGTPYAAPGTPIERAVCTIWAELLGIDRVGALDNFFTLGASSLLAIQAVGRLRRDHGLDVAVLKLFEFPTAATLAQSLGAPGAKAAAVSRRRPARSSALESVAIVGMAGRFPGASSVAALWQNLCQGLESIRQFTDAELDASIPTSLRGDPAYVKARGVIDGVELFDAAFFGINPKDAAVLDPQQRLLLEVAWEALEHSGYVPERIAGSVGVFAGKYNDSYYAQNVLKRPDLTDEIGAFQTMVLNEKDYVATHLAHRLNLRGPAVSIHTACSTSLVAVASAFDSLRLGHCDFALAGGASLTVPVHSGYLYQEGAMLSPDGHCRPFDAAAQGTTFSDGVAVLCLKRLSDALAAGDTVYAVLKGAATNNDGAAKASFTAPSVSGQAAVIERALEVAEVEARSISYVEAHGTATPLGDPIEVEALSQAFRQSTADVGFCGIGSVKSNLGHLVIAAGATGLIKTALSLREEKIPPTLFFQKPNPGIDFARSPFQVVSELKAWPRGTAPRRAGVSSFGVGGTNAHVILEEAPRREPGTVGRTEQMLVLSARTPASLDAATERLASHFQQNPDASLADVAYTLQLGRRGFSHRRIAVASRTEDVAAALQALEPRRVPTGVASARAPGVALLFPGQGAQYGGMGASLYARESVFRNAIDAGAEELRPFLGRDLREFMLADPSDAVAGEALRQTALAQPALFLVEHGLALLWQSWGVQPRAMVGHSVGEFVCAVLSGVMSRADALRLVALRGQLMQGLPPGAMLSVRLSATEVEKRLPSGIELAAENGPTLCVVAGPDAAIAAFESQLGSDGVAARRLVTSHAFHSAMMDPAIAPFRAALSEFALAEPAIPFVSTLTGTWITSSQARDPDYWARHLRATVRFAPAIKTLLAESDIVLLEVGPRATLTTLAKQQARDRVALASLGDGTPGAAEVSALLQAAGRLWIAGVELDFAALHQGERRLRVPLPTYAFDRKRFWAELPAVAPGEPAVLPSLPSSSAPIIEPFMTSASSSGHRLQSLTRSLRELVEESSGNEVGEGEVSATFMELGLDSLFLTQFALALGKRFGVKVSFRQLMEHLPSIAAVAEHLDRSMPAEALPSVPGSASAPSTPVAAPAPPVFVPGAGAAPSSVVQALVAEQLRIMTQQLVLLGGSPPAAVAPLAPASTSAPGLGAPAVASATPVSKEPEVITGPEKYDPKKAFGAIARIHVNRSEALGPLQQARLDAFIRRYNARTAKSKAFTQKHRAHMADPRVVTGFRPLVKELVYPIVVQRSAGAQLWDLDGNAYVDALNGFGCNLFGWQPDFVTKAVTEQLQTGHEIGPQSPLAAECAELICEFTGFDRAAFCNTGSEAVMGCVRIARTVTGRTKIAMFTGSYHGIFDEVIVRGTKKLKSYPAAPGIMANTAENVMVLDYGTPETLQILRDHASELAAVLIEPVQSRRPDFQPTEFLKELRELCTASGTVYIFDEVITGFRTCPGGAQEFYGIRADLASYGKVVGGGLPVGVIAGKREYMDALDGGDWQFGDASVPTVGVTYFAGTFVRHPLALSAVRSVLQHLKASGPELQRRTTALTGKLAAELNALFERTEAPLTIKHFSSLWKPIYTAEQPMGDLLFYMLRDRGVHIYDGFPCFMTTAHTEADAAHIVKAFTEGVAEMQESGFFPTPMRPRAPIAFDANSPPVPGARLGRDPEGNPAWYVPHAFEPGKYVKFTDA